MSDNAFVDAKGAAEKVAKKKLGIRRNTAVRVIREREKQPGGRYTTLEQIDAIWGMGPDTMSDLITSFFAGLRDDERWYPDENVTNLLPE
mgnify:CR=1 FL=1